MSIFDFFGSKDTNEPEQEKERRILYPIPYRMMFSELNAAGREAKAQYPADTKIIDDFVWALKDVCRQRHKTALSGTLEPMKAKAQFFLSGNRMNAYVCLLPPENDGDEITLAEFLDDMHYEGITYGILQEEIQQKFEYGYFQIFPVARGVRPQAGEDGKVTELFQRRKHMRLEVQNGSQVDFSQDVPLQPIRKGKIICMIQPPKPGTDGMDVTGQRLPCIQPHSAPVPQGKNTTISKSGQALVADTDGILYIENDQFCVHEQKIIDGDLEQFQGTLHISGNLYIGGNVNGGAAIEASGDIVINGELGEARVTSLNGTIRVQRGVHGTEGKTFLKAAGQVQSPIMEWAQIDAGTSVITESIVNSTIRCGGTVYAMTGRGIIVNSLIQAGDSILCLRIGNLAGGRSRFSIGYPPTVPESWARIKTELAEVQSTIQMLWKSIGDFKRKGNRISSGEQSVLEQLMVQRDLYTQKRETLTEELKAVHKILSKKSKGKIRCEKLYPPLEVQIGKLSEEIITQEENCDIHAVEYQILLKKSKD